MQPVVEMDEKVGWIGLGQIGAPMAERMLGRSGGLVVCDVADEATRPFAEAGAQVAATPAEVVAAGATLISIMVRDDDQVRDVVGQLCAVAAEGVVVAVHSTIDPQTAEELARSAAEHGIALVDAPVTGGVAGASTGRLAILVGGSDDATDRCRVAFAPFADLVVSFGPAGSATRAKIARNLVGFVGYAAVGEALRLADAFDLDLMSLGKVIRHSDAVTGGAGSIVLREETGVLDDDHWLRGVFEHTAQLGDKDLGLASSLGEEAGVDLPLAEVARRLLPSALGLDDAPDDR